MDARFQTEGGALMPDPDPARSAARPGGMWTISSSVPRPTGPDWPDQPALNKVLFCGLFTQFCFTSRCFLYIMGKLNHHQMVRVCIMLPISDEYKGKTKITSCPTWTIWTRPWGWRPPPVRWRCSSRRRLRRLLEQPGEAQKVQQRISSSGQAGGQERRRNGVIPTS